MNEQDNTAPTPQKWAGDPDNMPGRIQVGRINKACRALRMASQQRGQLLGSLDDPRDAVPMFISEPFSKVVHNPRALELLAEVGERYGYTVTKKNAAEITKALVGALPEAQSAIVIDDRRKSGAEVNAEQAEREEAAAVDNLERERTSADRDEAAAAILDQRPPGAVALIVAELDENQSDTVTDYHHHTTTRTVAIGWHTTTRASFSAWRKAAAGFEPTAHFGPGLGHYTLSAYTEEDQGPEHFRPRRRFDAYGDGPDTWTTEEAAHKAADDMIAAAEANETYPRVIGWGDYAAEHGYDIAVESVEVRGYGGPCLKLGGKDASGWRVFSLPLNSRGGISCSMTIEDGFPKAPKVTGRTEGDGYAVRDEQNKKGAFVLVELTGPRLERAEWEAVRDSAKAAGGWKSRKWGKCPGGFGFDTREKAEDWGRNGLQSALMLGGEPSTCPVPECGQPMGELSGDSHGCPVHGIRTSLERKAAPHDENNPTTEDGTRPRGYCAQEEPEPSTTWSGDAGSACDPVSEVTFPHLFSLLGNATRLAVGRSGEGWAQVSLDGGPTFEVSYNGGEVTVSPVDPIGVQGPGSDSVPTSWSSGLLVDAWDVVRAVAESMHRQRIGLATHGGDFCATVGGFPITPGASVLDKVGTFEDAPTFVVVGFDFAESGREVFDGFGYGMTPNLEDAKRYPTEGAALEAMAELRAYRLDVTGWGVREVFAAGSADTPEEVPTVAGPWYVLELPGGRHGFWGIRHEDTTEVRSVGPVQGKGRNWRDAAQELADERNAAIAERKPTVRAKAAEGSREREAVRLEELATRLDAKAEHCRRPLTQNWTPKRGGEHAYRLGEGDKREEEARGLRAVAAELRANTLPPILAKVSSMSGVRAVLGWHADHDGDAGAAQAVVLRALIEKGRTDADRDAESAREDGAELQAAIDATRSGGKRVGFFPTPAGLASRVVELLDLEVGFSVLEPSAGLGDLADVVWGMDSATRCTTVEIAADLCNVLKLKGYAPYQGDFLQTVGSDLERARFDRILMNPPFEKKGDQRHVAHAMDFLADKGRLVSVMTPAGAEWAVETFGGYVEEVEPGAFKGAESHKQTGVSVALFVFDSEGDQ